ncbi:dUTP diphosphatase [bacterium]|nr:dUTP diphosphatase [bacterium]
MEHTPEDDRDDVVLVEASEGSSFPVRATEGAAGVDLAAAVDFVVEPGRRLLVDTGLKLVIPRGAYGQIQGRSGLATKSIDAHPGVIDSDYRGPVKVLLMNRSNDVFIGSKGDRIAQLLILPVITPTFQLAQGSVEAVAPTERGSGGFGSTDPKVSKR